MAEKKGNSKETFGKRNRTRAQIGKSSRAKGARFERDVSHMLTARGFDAKRGVQFKGGLNSHDVSCDILGMYNLELKAVEALNIYSALEQGIRDCGEGQTPIIIHKKNNREILTTMRFHDWVNLLQWAFNYVDKYNFLELDRSYFDEKEVEDGRDTKGTSYL